MIASPKHATGEAPVSGDNGKRRSERLPGRFRVEVREKLARWTTITEDVSGRGCRVEMKRPLVPGMLVQLAFDMGAGEEPLVAHAQVAWVRRAEPEAAGFAFLSMPREARHPQPGFWIDRLLSARVRELSQSQRTAPARAVTTIVLPPVA